MTKKYVLRIFDTVTQEREMDEEFKHLFSAIARVVAVRTVMGILESPDCTAISVEQIEELLEKGTVTVGETVIILLRVLPDREVPVISV